MVIFYDWVSCGLWTIELLVLLTGNVFAFISSIRIAFDSVLHYNFRVIFISLFTRTLLLILERAIIIIARTFVYGERELPFQRYISYEQVFVIAQMGFSLLAISLERVIALLDNNYEHRCRTISARMLVPIALCAPALILTVSYFVGGSATGSIIQIIPFAYLTSGITTSAVFFISRGRFRTRHMRGLRLDQKFASAESIRATRIFIPCVINDVFCFLILIALSIYSINCTPYPVGEDPTKLSHAYDMLAAYKSAFIPCFLFFKYRKIQKRHAIEASVDDKRRSFEEGKQIYFKDLHAIWKF